VLLTVGIAVVLVSTAGASVAVPLSPELRRRQVIKVVIVGRAITCRAWNLAGIVVESELCGEEKR
jgi:hypothetical protein